MKKTGLIFIFSSLVWACQKSSLPSITRRTTEPPAPSSQVRTDFTADLNKGKTIFASRCVRCHGLHDPAEFNSEKWDKILERMIPRARLTKEEAANVTAYIQANVAK